MGYDGGSEGSVLVEALGEAELGNTTGVGLLALPLAGGNVVGGDVAGNVLVDLVGGDVFSGLSDDDGELTLVVGLLVLGELGDRDGLAPVSDGGGGLDEDGGEGRGGTAGLLD